MKRGYNQLVPIGQIEASGGFVLRKYVENVIRDFEGRNIDWNSFELTVNAGEPTSLNGPYLLIHATALEGK